MIRISDEKQYYKPLESPPKTVERKRPTKVASPQKALADPYQEIAKKHFLEHQLKNSAGNSLGCDIGSEKWLQAKIKADALKKYAAEVKEFSAKARALR
jgi:hypothetical protein